jgi:hypothetical protein
VLAVALELPAVGSGRRETLIDEFAGLLDARRRWIPASYG